MTYASRFEEFLAIDHRCVGAIAGLELDWTLFVLRFVQIYAENSELTDCSARCSAPGKLDSPGSCAPSQVTFAEASLDDFRPPPSLRARAEGVSFSWVLWTRAQEMRWQSTRSRRRQDVGGRVLHQDPS